MYLYRQKFVIDFTHLNSLYTYVRYRTFFSRLFRSVITTPSAVQLRLKFCLGPYQP
jgi:hypothetical protein